MSPLAGVRIIELAGIGLEPFAAIEACRAAGAFGG